jgi:hypothetical protein
MERIGVLLLNNSQTKLKNKSIKEKKIKSNANVNIFNHHF